MKIKSFFALFIALFVSATFFGCDKKEDVNAPATLRIETFSVNGQTVASSVTNQNVLAGQSLNFSVSVAEADNKKKLDKLTVLAFTPGATQGQIIIDTALPRTNFAVADFKYTVASSLVPGNSVRLEITVANRDGEKVTRKYTLDVVDGSNQAPSITDFQVNGATPSTASKDVAPGEVVNFTVDASDAEALKEAVATVAKNSDAASTIKTQTLTGTSGRIQFSFTIPANAVGGDVFNIQVVFKDAAGAPNSDVSRSFQLNVVNDISSFSAVIMGAQSNANIGSFYNVAADRVMLFSEAQNAQSTVDFVYYYGASNLATVAAPADATVPQVLAPVANWTTRNSTKFIKKPTLTTTDFSGATEQTLIQAWDGTEDTKVIQLAVGNIVAFKTVNGKYGLFRVSNISGTDGTGSITIDVKVQQ